MRITLFLTFFTLVNFGVYAQAPEKMSYQAVIRNSANNLVQDSDVNLKILIKQGSTNGLVVYEELHDVHTNTNGLISLQIGTGQINKGDFTSINWQKGPYFIESHIDPEGRSNYSITGVSQMLSVPYSLHAKTAETVTGKILASQIAGLSSFNNGTVDGTESIFSGDYKDLVNAPEIYTKIQVDSLLINNGGSEGTIQSLSLDGQNLSITGGNSISFEGSEMDVSDNFDGKFKSLTGVPELYNKNEVEDLITAIEGGDGNPQLLGLDGNTLSISAGNTISFEGWDMDASDDFSGNYKDLIDLPELFSSDYNDLINAPEIYTKNQVDSLAINNGGSEGAIQSLRLDGQNLTITEGNSISFEGWDSNSADDFSGIYEDLVNKPEIFSGEFNALKNIPILYSAEEVDNLINGIETNGGVSQNLNLDQSTLSISGGNSISFDNWDTNASDDFSGIYEDLVNKPEIFSGEFNTLKNIPNLYTAEEVDNLINGIETNGGVSQNLNLDQNTLSISGGNSISFENWDSNAADDFSGIYEDLQNKPELYDKTEIDNLISGIETTGGVSQNLNLDQTTLFISGGNSISFDNWDTNASDDFSGIYEDLVNKPEIFSGEFNALKNIPILYTAEEVDNLINGIETNGGVSQNLNLDQSTLSISGGNSISFDNWDTNAADDFSGNYKDLIDLPELFSSDYNDLINAPEIYTKNQVDSLTINNGGSEGTIQSLSLDGQNLTITGGNSISFEGWDMDASDDFDGDYSSLTGTPIFYTQEEVDNIKAEILKDVEDNYAKKAEIISFTSSRNINSNDVGNTIACIYSSTLTISSGFSAMQVGDVINLEVHGTTLTVNGTSGVVINGKSGGYTEIGNDEVYTGGLIRKTGNNSYIVL